MIYTAEIGNGQLAELVKQVQAGHDVLLMQSGTPVAKLVAASESRKIANAPLRIRSIKGHRVLTPPSLNPNFNVFSAIETIVP